MAFNLRKAVVPAIDRFVLNRFGTLAGRGARGRYPEAVSTAAVRGFRGVANEVGAGGTPPPGFTDALAVGLEGLQDRRSGASTAWGSRRLRQAIIDQVHRFYYHNNQRNTWKATYYRGHRVLKTPLDLWTYQEILHDIRPDVIIETGTFYGGSAFYLADLCETLGRGKVITIDVLERDDRPKHQRITQLIGSSVDPELVAQVDEMIPDGATVLVILDSDHRTKHVIQELDVWRSRVTVGSYLICEDTNINGHPVHYKFGPGPWEAVEAFLALHPEFESDLHRERFMLSQNPRGYLKRLR